MRPIDYRWKDGNIEFYYKHDPTWIVTVLYEDEIEDRSIEAPLKYAKSIVDLWNAHTDEGTWEIVSLDIRDIIEVAMREETPLPSVDDVDNIVHRFTKVAQILMEDWQTYLAEIMDDL